MERQPVKRKSDMTKFAVCLDDDPAIERVSILHSESTTDTNSLSLICSVTYSIPLEMKPETSLIVEQRLAQENYS